MRVNKNRPCDQEAKRSAKLVTFRVLYKKDCHVASLLAMTFEVSLAMTFEVSLAMTFGVSLAMTCGLEQESGIDVECAVSVLLVEAASVLECYDEVLVHDEAETCTGCCMETVLA